MTVDCDLRVAQSRRLLEQPLIWPRNEAEHKVNLNPQIPHQHQDGPDPVIQSSLWQRMIGVPPIPAPILVRMEFLSRASAAIARCPIPTARLESSGTSRWLTKVYRFLTSLPAHRCLSRYRFHLTSNFLNYPKLGAWPDGY